MSRKDYQHKKIPLEKLDEVIRKMEDPHDPDGFNEFRNTAIYDSFKFNYNLRTRN